jgi:hypothetical protein
MMLEKQDIDSPPVRLFLVILELDTFQLPQEGM